MSMRGAAMLLARLATRLMPASKRHWGEAMEYEAHEIADPAEALWFALGCVGGAIRINLLRTERSFEGFTNMTLLDRPRRMIAASAIGATGLGMVYMNLADAPARYPAMNGVALLLGFALAGIVGLCASGRRNIVGAAHVWLGAVLLGTTLFGATVNGATRWVAVGGLFVQPSLIVLPVLAIGFARSRDALSLGGILLAALALALQPDRAMAGALAAGMLALAATRPERNVLAALAASLAGLAAALLAPDTQPAMPFVDKIVYSSFAAHPIAGAAVIAGLVLLLAPAIVGGVRDPSMRHAWAVFGAVWLATIVAAVAGNYPTPLVGYSGSAILGYVLCLLALPKQALAAVARGAEGSAAAPEPLDRLRADLAPAS